MSSTPEIPSLATAPVIYGGASPAVSAESISAYLRNNPDAEVRHIYGKWIVLQSLRHGSSIFSGIHETDFFKF